MMRHFPNHDFNKKNYLGFLSWKFKIKTHISGSDFLRFIKNNPGYDLYYINPFPDQTFHLSIWDHGQKWHPNFLDTVKTLFLELGYDTNLLYERYSYEDFLFCNYWVANKNFWEKYVSFVGPIIQHIQSNPASESVKKMRALADPVRNMDYIPFVLERMICCMIHNSYYFEFSKIGYSYSCREILKKNLSNSLKVFWCLRAFKVVRAIVTAKVFRRALLFIQKTPFR